MLFFPNSKINLGLCITGKRPDGFHNIETVFYPVSWEDALEVIEGATGDAPFAYSSSGLPVSGSLEGNLVYKAWKSVTKLRELPPIKVHLHKHIPMGAGLGGGSSDAAAFLNLLDLKFSLNLSYEEKFGVTASLGSDCAFFLKNTAIKASGKGDVFAKVNCDLGNYYILVVYPAVHSDTKAAYASVQPKTPARGPAEIVEGYPVQDWEGLLVNDFEKPVFAKYPAIGRLKEDIYKAGALYASMSGSGSAVFGIFEKEPEVKLPQNFQYYLQKPQLNIL